MNKLKRGNIIIITVLVFITVIFIVAMFILYYQINSIINLVRKDLFYISNNVIIAIDKEGLCYSNYNINIDKAKEMCENLLKKNHVKEGGTIKDIVITRINFNKNDITPTLELDIKIIFEPLINLGKTQYEIILKEKTKISLLEYN